MFRWKRDSYDPVPTEEVSCGPCGGTDIKRGCLPCRVCRGGQQECPDRCNNGKKECSTCSGKGTIECRTCDGKKECPDRCNNGKKECPDRCNNGKKECSTCSGKGTIKCQQNCDGGLVKCTNNLHK